MAFVNKKKCYPGILICLLLISIACVACVLCTNDINRIFLKPNEKNICTIDSDEKFTFEQNLIEKHTEEKENEENNNVLNRLKVLLKKVKKEVSSDVNEGSESKNNNTDTQPIELNSPNQTTSVSKEDKVEKSDKLLLKGDLEDKHTLHSQSSNIKIVEKTKVLEVEDLKERNQATVIEASVEAANTQDNDKAAKKKSKIKARNSSEHFENADKTVENTPQRGTQTGVSGVLSLVNLNVVQNTSSEWQESSNKDEEKEEEETKNELDSVSVNEEKNAIENATVPVQIVETEGNETVNVSESTVGEVGSDSVTAESEVDLNASTVRLDEEIIDEIPKETDQLETYSQFAERVLAEKKNGAGGSNGHGGNGQGSTKGPKVKSKNYASTDCGAKFITANPEASHSHKIINSNKDEYMLNKCTEKIWVVVELCESIKPQKFDIANFELFSNLPKEIQLYGSHRYPTRDWVSLGVFQGEEGNRDAQSFNVETQEFFKFIKLEVHSHYGTEFYCPLSLFRMYGLSEFEIIEEETDDEEEEDNREEKDALPEVEKEKNGIMMPDVLKAMFNGVLEVIKRGSRSGNITDLPELNTYNQTCKSLKEDFTVKNESCNFADSLNYILACYYDEYVNLLVNPFIASVVQNTYFCQHLATFICTSPHNNDSYVYDSVCNNSYACVMLSPKHILAMCYMKEPSLLNEFIGCESEETEEAQQSNNFSANSNIEEIPVEIPVNVPERGDKDTEEIPQNGQRNLSSEADPPEKNELKTEEVHSSKTEDEAITEAPEEQKQNLPQEANHNVNLTSAEKSVNTSSPILPDVADKTEKPADKKKEKKSEKVTVEKNKEADDSPTQETKPTTATPTIPTTTPLPPTSAIPTVSTENRVASHSNKESVVVRLSNKIKVLEHNMSISSQYLEELSRRYKRQMEDMERQFNITILALNRTSQTAYERDLYHQNRLETLENQLEELTKMVTTLVQEKESLLMNVIEQHIILLFIEVLVMCLVFTFCLKRRRDEVTRGISSSTSESTVKADESKSGSSVCSVESDQQGRDTPSHYRRRSVDSIKMKSEVKPKERRFSGQAAVIGSYKDLMLTETTTKEKKRKKKKIQLQRSLSNASIHDAKKRSSSVSSKKERKLEKLKKSCAGVLFSGEKRNSDSMLQQNISNGTKQDDWHVVKRNKSKKTKGEFVTQGSDDQMYVFSSDLNRGKITLIEEPPLCDIYQDPYYSDMIYDNRYEVYDKTYIDSEYKDYVQCHYTQDIEPSTISDSINQVYDVPDFDCNAPVINDYYNTTDMSYNSRIIEEQDRNGHGHEETITSLWDADGGSKTMVKALRQPVVPLSLKGKTRLRSDNWEWYSSQPSRLNSKLSNSAEVISTSSSSDSSSRSKLIISDIKIDTLKCEKKKKKKKGLKFTNGDNH